MRQSICVPISPTESLSHQSGSLISWLMGLLVQPIGPLTCLLTDSLNVNLPTHRPAHWLTQYESAHSLTDKPAQ
ncbi:MAG: hypothetical protein V9G20_01330 [Candidatus Promineifilaceae bacterium]